MKKLGLLLTGLLFAATTFATEGRGEITKRDDAQSKIAIMQGREMVRLVYLNDDANQVAITIYSETGQKLNTTYVNNEDGFILPYNFNQLEYGQYTFEITDANGTTIESVNYEVKDINKSVVYNIKDTDKFRVNVLAENEDVTIKILDAENQVVHQELIPATTSFSRVYDLEAVEKKGYVFQVESGDHTDYHLAGM